MFWRLALPLCVAGGGLQAAAQSKRYFAHQPPKLVVQIVVGHMRADYLQRFKNNFTTKGFRVFINEGTVFSNAGYGYALTQTMPGLATIAAGCSPAQHGITADNWYDRNSDKVTSACRDPEARDLEGGSRFPFSPRQLMATTFGDEMKLAAPDTRVFSVAMHPEAAIMAGGHTADAAFWWDADRGAFTSNQYYMPKLPEWANEFNAKKFAASYLARPWNTLYPYRRYTAKAEPKTLAFQHKGDTYLMLREQSASQGKPDYAALCATPYADNLLKDFVNTLIVSENLGREAGTDIVMVYLNACKEAGGRYGILSVELEDAVYRTDENIKQFISFLQDHIGKEQVLVVLASDHGAGYSQKELSAHRLPHGSLESRRALILLKSYLKALYGKGEWVKAFHQRQVYLNRLHIEETNKSIYRIHDKCAEFLSQMTGVAFVTSSISLDNNDSGISGRVKNSYHPKRSGDLILTLHQGWTEDTSGEESSASPYAYDTRVPLCFYGWQVKPQTIDAPTDMTNLAPTLSFMLGAPLPAAATGQPIVEIWK